MRWIIIAAILEETFRENLQAIFNAADRQCRWPNRRPCWVTLYGDIIGEDPHQFAPGIVSAAGVRALLPGRPPSLLAVVVNLLFAVVLGIVLTFAWRAIRARRPELTNPLPFALAALAVVWALNFFVVLPIVRPEFVHLVPYGVSLTSSLLFGAAVVAVLHDNLAFSSGTR
jgi:hypothetical protein